MKSCGQRIQGVVGDKWGTSKDKWETNVKSCGQGILNAVGKKTSPETNVKSCGPSMHHFQRSKHPSQVSR